MDCFWKSKDILKYLELKRTKKKKNLERNSLMTNNGTYEHDLFLILS